jgi:hypothetical protein
LAWFEKEECWYRYTQDEEGNITGIFWYEKQQIAWLRERRFSRCLSLDCTYSTNNKRMPYFQGTALSHTKKILPLFQAVECVGIVALCRMLAGDADKPHYLSLGQPTPTENPKQRIFLFY